MFDSMPIEKSLFRPMSRASMSIWMIWASGFQAGDLPYFRRKSIGVPRTTITSACSNAGLRESEKKWGLSWRSVPRPMALV